MADQAGTDGAWAGTKGRSLRMEAFQIDFRDPPVPNLGIEYMCHIQGSGDSPKPPMPWLHQGQKCGTNGLSLRLEGFATRLTGSNASAFTLTYKCHVQGAGDKDPDASGYCGTKGQGLGAEAMFVDIVKN
jgi:uncharacterized protein YjdB